MHRPIKVLALGLFLLAGCAPGVAYQKDSSEGYCFKAEGLRESRCYAQYESCSRREDSLRQITQIESECQLHAPGMLSVNSVAKTTAAQH